MAFAPPSCSPRHLLLHSKIMNQLSSLPSQLDREVCVLCAVINVLSPFHPSREHLAPVNSSPLPAPSCCLHHHAHQTTGSRYASASIDRELLLLPGCLDQLAGRLPLQPAAAPF
ncbi:hypothetical protein VIGAN_09073200 [Vigna angularis var. angularis]|uniref:Uncharacterized protein n=1 Tax=Vigna angularis var. angularis TaxID=157739 RepID=A0A0S3SWQ3_PHAAN|nr:hypothetical protein VIGAN_09073200 [Vigna angularis var. angularis]